MTTKILIVLICIVILAIYTMTKSNENFDDVTTLPTGYISCANDGQACSNYLGGDLYYGSKEKGKYTVLPAAQVPKAPFTCLPSGFSPISGTTQVLPLSDPLPNVAKTCYVSPTAPTTTTAATTTATTTATPTTTSTTTSTTSYNTLYIVIGVVAVVALGGGGGYYYYKKKKNQ